MKTVSSLRKVLVSLVLAGAGALFHSAAVHADGWALDGSTLDISTLMLLGLGAVGIVMTRVRMAKD